MYLFSNLDMDSILIILNTYDLKYLPVVFVQPQSFILIPNYHKFKYDLIVLFFVLFSGKLIH